jgi:N-terminal acetyltransferase B complex catalytic subunit
MAGVRRFMCGDLLDFNAVNLDALTETYNMPFYQTYLARWPEYFQKAVGPGGHLMGYVMGKAEGRGKNWHGHVSAVTVAPQYRRQGLAAALMDSLEEITREVHNGYFVDLFVRVSNVVAIGMYEKFGYTSYRRVIGYYGEEDGLDMRKAMPRDSEGRSVIPLGRPVYPEELEYD